VLATTFCTIGSDSANSHVPLCRQAGAWLRGIIFVCGLWCAAGVASAGIGTWTPIGPSGTRALIADPVSQDLYATNDTAPLFRSSDSGSSWYLVPAPSVPNCSFAYDIPGNGALFAHGSPPTNGPFNTPGCDRAHYKSTDRGISWVLLPPWPDNIFVRTSDPTNSSVLYGIVVPTSVYKSVDGGATWSLLPTGTPFPFGLGDIAVDAQTSSTLYTFGGKNNFLKSTDGGASWVSANVGLLATPDQPSSGMVGFAQVGTTLILATNGSGIFRSDNGAATWAPANAGLPNLQLLILVKSGAAVPTLYTAANNGNSITFFHSTDSATTWVQTGTVDSPLGASLAFSPQSPTTAFVSTAVGLFKSTDATAIWSRVPPDIGLPSAPVPLLLGDNGNPLRLYASATIFSRSYSYRSADGGKNWSLLALPDKTPVFLLPASTSRTGAVYGIASGGGYVRSVNGGVDWSALPLSTPGFSVVTRIVEGPTNSKVLFAAGNTAANRLPGSSAFVQRSDDDGMHWADASHGIPGVPSGNALTAIAIDPTNSSTLYVAAANQLFKTIDGGANWSAIGSGFPTNDVSTLCVDPSHPNILYAAFDASSTGTPGVGVYASIDGGVTWSPRNAGLSDLTITALVIDRNDPSSLYVGTDKDGVFRTIDGGLRWTTLNDGLPAGDALKIQSLVVDPVDGRNVFAGTANGAFSFTLDPSTSFVPVIEYYAASLDHYFMASVLQRDVAALDSGAIPGWARTGQTFRGFPSSGPPSAATPVCRFYIPPVYGDSHFYSASPTECDQVRAKYPFFVYESGNAFYVYLPDTNTGACPQATIPVYRVWDKRVDTNHRYTIDLAVRDQMVARGWVAEGYGPNQAIMCAPQ
jgi:photosystem II stability/assembly factor-like uncharacterized protein